MPKLDEVTCRRICEALGLEPEKNILIRMTAIVDEGGRAITRLSYINGPRWFAVQRAAEEQSPPSPSPSRGE